MAGCNQILGSYAYDRLGRRTQTDYHGALNAGTSGVSYAYEADSDLVRLDHRFNAAADVTFAHEYNASGRLTATHTDLSARLSPRSHRWRDVPGGGAGGTARNRSYTVNTVTDRVTGWSGHQAQGVRSPLEPVAGLAHPARWRRQSHQHALPLHADRSASQ